MLISFEGVEGSGKSTQAERLAARLERAGVPCLFTREPGGTPAAEEIRRLVQHADAIPPMTELLLYLAARSINVAEVVRPALEAGRVVVTDRWSMSTLAYQGYGRQLPLAEVRRTIDFATGGLWPDVTFLLQVPLEVGSARRAGLGDELDRIERAGRAFHERVAQAYALLSTELPGVEVLDGTADADAVEAEIVRRLARRDPETFPFGEG